MKFTLLSSFVFLLISAVFSIQSSNALSQPSELTTFNISPRRNVASYLEKRKSSKKSNDCANATCQINSIPKCPKDCPDACNYESKDKGCCQVLSNPYCPEF